ncbi:basic proline-rich protein-like [Penaeus indicus]|uniref:basic proline-rich protein-like n=1 Tax=Penaeus indicus TaxID=29960 RepID=UPI00300C91A6
MREEWREETAEGFRSPCEPSRVSRGLPRVTRSGSRLARDPGSEPSRAKTGQESPVPSPAEPRRVKRARSRAQPSQDGSREPGPEPSRAKTAPPDPPAQPQPRQDGSREPGSPEPTSQDGQESPSRAPSRAKTGQGKRARVPATVGPEPQGRARSGFVPSRAAEARPEAVAARGEGRRRHAGAAPSKEPRC